MASVLVRASSTMRAWRSAPAATSPMASAISFTVRPVSSELEDISSDAALIDEAWPATSPRARESSAHDAL